jgi:hypothetical protein
VTAPLVFGVFPLGMAGGPGGVAKGAPDDFEAIGRALGELYSPKPAFFTLRSLISELG